MEYDNRAEEPSEIVDGAAQSPSADREPDLELPTGDELLELTAPLTPIPEFVLVPEAGHVFVKIATQQEEALLVELPTEQSDQLVSLRDRFEAVRTEFAAKLARTASYYIFDDALSTDPDERSDAGRRYARALEDMIDEFDVPPGLARRVMRQSFQELAGVETTLPSKEYSHVVDETKASLANFNKHMSGFGAYRIAESSGRYEDYQGTGAIADITRARVLDQGRYHSAERDYVQALAELSRDTRYRVLRVFAPDVVEDRSSRFDAIEGIELAPGEGEAMLSAGDLFKLTALEADSLYQAPAPREQVEGIRAGIREWSGQLRDALQGRSSGDNQPIAESLDSILRELKSYLPEPQRHLLDLPNDGARFSPSSIPFVTGFRARALVRQLDILEESLSTAKPGTFGGALIESLARKAREDDGRARELLRSRADELGDSARWSL